MRQVQSVKYSKILDQKWLASACIYIWSGTCQVGCVPMTEGGLQRSIHSTMRPLPNKRCTTTMHINTPAAN